MLGLGAIGQFAIGEQTLATSQAEIITVDKWFQPLSEPPRFRRGLRASLQQFAAPSPQPFVPFFWFEALSEPAVKNRRGLKASQQQFLAFDPQPFVSFGWFGQLTEPSRKKRGLPAALQQSFATDPTVIPISRMMPWFVPLSEPPRFKPGLRAALQQALAWPPRVLPPPTVTATMSANETPDSFLGGASFWNRIISGEVGVIEYSFTGGEIGIVERNTPPGASGIIEPVVASAGGAAVPQVTSAHISIRIV